MMFHRMRRLMTVAMIAAGFAGHARAEFVTANDFSDLVVWAGSGTNASAFVLQFGTAAAPTAIAWGYRWNGSATASDMIFSLAGDITVTNGGPLTAGDDPRLSVDATYYEFGEATGYYLTAIRYDQAGLPPAWAQTTRSIVDAYALNGTYPVLYAAPAAGGTWTGAGSPPVMPFAYSEVGISDLVLTSGGWYGFVQGTGVATLGFTQPVAAVPEPSGAAIVAGWAVVSLTARLLTGRRQSPTRGGA